MIDTELADRSPEAVERELDLRDQRDARPGRDSESRDGWWQTGSRHLAELRVLMGRSVGRLRRLGRLRQFGRRRLLLLGGGLALVVILGGVLAAGAIKSPATVAAEALPPPVTTLTEPVTSRVLSKSIFVAGTVEPRTVFEARSGGAPGGGRSVFTAVNVKRGDRVAVGQRLAEVSGRPIVVLPGATPAYRDLLPNSQGRDVEQLQRALAVKRWYHATVSGVVDEATKVAITKMYSAMGYRPIEVGVDELSASQAQVKAARRALAEAVSSLKGVKGGSPEVASLERAAGYAREDLAQAEQALEKTAANAGPTVPVGEYLFVPTLPATVMDVPAAVGAEANGVAVRLSSGALVVRGDLDPVQRSSVAVGQTAEIIAGDSRFSGTVELVDDNSVAADPAGGAPPGAAATQSKVTIVSNKPIPVSMFGDATRVVVTAQSTPAPVLAVPITAITSKPSGATVISLMGAGAEQREVEVRTGFVGDGYVEIQPIQGVVNEGEIVVVTSRSDGPAVAQSEYQ